MALLVISYALLDYERYEKSSSVELPLLAWAYLPNSRLRHLSHGGRDATRSQGTELAKMQCFGLRGCFWGDAHAGVSSQVQLGVPSRHFLHGGRDATRSQGHRAS